DVGGTNIRAARITPSGTIVDHRIERVANTREGFASQIAAMVAEVKDASCVGVGVGIPGRVDAHTNRIVSAGYLDIAGLDLVALLDGAHGLPTTVENDALMALIAEVHCRLDAKDGLILMVTIGTGIGGAIIEDQSPWYGGGFAGQFGHLVVADASAERDDPVCNCGRYGCVETLSSGTALRALMAEARLPDSVRAGDLLARAEAGDDVASGILDRWSAPFHRALETLTSAFDPRLIVIGGGLGQEMVQALQRTEQRSLWFDVPFEAARFRDDAGVIGAGLHCFPPDQRLEASP
ncbi:MAG: ROK family protein, partial [Devosiaceae bacterium]|nr:ROK family protein [Devosiaceae bacterium MH13]